MSTLTLIGYTYLCGKKIRRNFLFEWFFYNSFYWKFCPFCKDNQVTKGVILKINLSYTAYKYISQTNKYVSSYQTHSKSFIKSIGC